MDIDERCAEPGLTITVIVCAFNEALLLPACLFSLRAQTRPPDQILVINNASTDETRAAAEAVPGVTVVDEPIKGLVVARETARRVAHGDIVAYVDALIAVRRSCGSNASKRGSSASRRPWRSADRISSTTGTGPARMLIRLYDMLVAPPTHALVHHAVGIGAVLYGGNFAVRRDALAQIGGFDRSVEFHGEDTNLGRRLTPIGRIELARECWVWTSARRYRAMGKSAVFG